MGKIHFLTSSRSPISNGEKSDPVFRLRKNKQSLPFRNRRPLRPHPGQGLIWREMHDFSPDCVLLVLADDYYNEVDYIRDYRRFLDLEKEINK